MTSEVYHDENPSGFPSSNAVSRQAWVVCLSAAMFFFYEFIQMHMFNAINEDLRQAFQVNATELGVLSSTYLMADVLFLLPAGFLLDRFSTRKIILIAIGLCIIGTFGFALTHSLFWAGFYHFLSGIGNAFCFLSCIMLVSRWFPPKRQAFVIGLVVTLAFIGGVMAQTPLAWLAQKVGWRDALIIDAFLGLGILFLIYWNVVDRPPQHQQHTVTPSHQSQPLLAIIKAVFSNPQNWLAGLYISSLNLPIMVLDAVWGVSYIQKVHGFNSSQAANISAMIFFGSILGSPLVGWISDRIGRRKSPMLYGAIFSLLIIVLVIAFPSLSYWSLLTLFFLLGLSTSTQIIGYPMVAESNPEEITGSAMGLTSVLVMGGAGVAQVLYGYLLDFHWQGTMELGKRVYSAFEYQWAMWMFPIAFVLALIAMAIARETYCRRES